MTHTIIESPIGELLVLGRPWPDDPSTMEITALYTAEHVRRPAADADRDDQAFVAVRQQLLEYFSGGRAEFDLPLAPQGTNFQQRVWAELRRIPYGQTASYTEIAQRIGQPTAVRAVGMANGRNPISLIVPCHRVVGSDGSLTGYAGGLDAKRWLLRHEQSGFGAESGAAPRPVVSRS